MKAKTPPTSPKYKVKEIEKLYKDNSMKIEKPHPAKGGLILMVTIAIIVGFLSGFLGKIIFDYLNIAYPERFSILNQNVNKEITKSEQETNIIYSEIYQRVNPAIVDIYVKKEKTEDSLEGIYLKGDKKGSGLILSSDGFIITTDKVIEDKGEQYIVITDDQKVYNVAGFYDDPSTTLIFLKMSEAENLKVAQTFDFNNLLVGATAYAIDSNNLTQDLSFVITNIRGIFHEDAQTADGLVRSSEILDRYVFTNSSFNSSWEGTPLVDKNGKVIGIYSFDEDYKNKFIPVDYIIDVVNNLLKEDEVLRVYLGIKYVDLSESVNITEALSQEKTEGILIYSPYDEAVEKNSPAEKASLEQGDIITKVEQTSMDKNNNFSEVIQNLNIGDTITLIVDRNGVEREINVTLDKY